MPGLYGRWRRASTLFEDLLQERTVDHFGGSVIGKDGEALLHERHILGRVVDEEVDVFGETARAVSEDGKAADWHIASPGGVQGAADADEVFRFWCSCVPSRRAAGYQLGRVQQGLMPDDWKAMTAIGAGVSEIRIHTDLEHRVFYVAKYEETVYVIHAFEKRTSQTRKADIALARKRLADFLGQRAKKKEAR